MRTYEVTITGKSPLLMHWDNLDWTAPKKWREEPENKSKSVPGDDRSPAFTWIGGLYHDGKIVSIPTDNIMRCAMEGGAQVPVPGGKRGKTYKTQTQSGMVTVEAFWPLLVDGKPIAVEPILKLTNESDFEKHQAFILSLGFELYVKRARIGASKHVRVRPRFNRWATRGLINVWDEEITLAALSNIMRIAGAYKGLGDWRPSSRTPGPFGRFDAEVKEVEEVAGTEL